MQRRTLSPRIPAFSCLTVLGCLIVGSRVRAQPTTKRVPSQIVVKAGETFAFLGASITAQGWQSPNGYVQIVVNTLARNGAGVIPLPSGVSGNTSRDMLARLDKDVIAQHPDWVTIDAGGNDVWHGGVPLDEYKRNLTAIVDRTQAAGIRVILQTCTPITEDLGDDFNLKLALCNQFQRELAARKHCLLADINADAVAVLKTKTTKDNLLTLDGVHMNDRGNRLMATGLLKAMGLTDAQIAAGAKP